MHRGCDGIVLHVSSSLNSTCTENHTEIFKCSLDYYASHIPSENNTVLLLDSGTHFLHSSIMLFDRLRNLSIIGSSDIVMSSRGLLEPVTKIQCIGNSGFVFTHIQNLSLRNVFIESCGGRSMSFSAAALLLIDTFNVTLYNIIVKNSIQYGMIGFDMLGSSHLSDCSFVSNPNQSGGNVMLSWSMDYDDACKASNYYTLVLIDNSIFAYANSDGNKASGLHIDHQQSCRSTFVTLTNTTFIENRGGNIAVFVKQHNLSQNVFYFQLEKSAVMNGLAVDDSTAAGISFVIEGDSPSSQYYLNVKDSLFKENKNSLGSTGGLYLDISGLVNFRAEISGCNFINNTGHDGGAVSINLTNTATDNDFSQTGLNHTVAMISFTSCRFEQNNASKGGGIFINMYDLLASDFNAYLIDINDCVLYHNAAIQGGSALFTSNKLGSNRVLSVNMSSTIIIEHNKIIDLVTPIFTSVDATIVFKATNAMISNSTFTNNTGSGIFADHSEITFANTVVFDSNSAIRGGGLQLSNSQLYLLNETYLIFENNHASAYGGAVYIYESPLILLQIQPVCFAIFKKSKPYDNVLPQLVFRSNKAKYGGNAIYAPRELTDPCASSSETAHNVIFNIQDESQSFENLSSLPVAKEICMCYDNKPKCKMQNVSITVAPGSTFNLQVATVNYKGETVPSVVSAKVENEDFLSNSSSIIDEFQMTQHHCTNLKYILFSYNPVERVTMYVVDYSAAHPLNFFIDLLPCPSGFTILQETSPRCDCIPQLHQLGITCRIDDKTFQIKGDVWIGTSGMSDKNSSLDSLQNNSILYSSSCPFGYCIEGFRHISLDDPDAQCSSNRCGTLCGQCLPGLSISLGRANCIECSNAYTALLVFVFGAAGLGLIAFLRLFNITISQGSPNPFMFYANVIHVNDTFFFRNRHTDPLTVFVSWMNLDFGIESCFYDGMDALQKAFLQFAFPSYLLLIIGIIVLVSRRSTRLTRLLGSNGVSIISTLLHLSFFKLFRATIAIFLYTRLHYENGEHFSVWRYDGNNYYHSSYILLILLSSGVLIFFIIPYILIIVCTPIITRKGYRICRVRFWRLMPIFDAYLAPYKYKMIARSWNGLTTVLYSILLITSTEVDTAINLLLIAISSILLIVLNGLFGGIYRRWAFSVLEVAVHLNLTCLALLSLFAILKGYTVDAIVSTSVGLSLFAFCGIVIYHATIAMTTGRRWSRFKSKKIIEQPDEQFETYPSNATQSVVELPTSRGPFTYNYYFEEPASPEPKPVPRARDEILVTCTESQGSTITTITALLAQQSNLKPPTSTVIALEDLNVEEDTEAEELIRNNQMLSENLMVVEINDVAESEAGNSEPKLSINSENTSYTSVGESQQEVSIAEAYALTAAHESLSSDYVGERKGYIFRHSRRELHSYRSTRPLDSDTDATGQKPSHAITKCHLVRRIDPLELEIVDEGDSECDEPLTQLKIHKFKPKKVKKSKQEPVTGQLQGSKSIAINMSQFENKFDENIPLLSLEAASEDVTTFTDLNMKLKKKQIDHPLILFEEAQNITTSSGLGAESEKKQINHPFEEDRNKGIITSTHLSIELEKNQLDLPLIPFKGLHCSILDDNSMFHY